MQTDLEESFGRIAMAQGWVKPSQVEDALKAVRKLAKLGFREKLGTVMVKKGYLAPQQVNEILRAQGDRARNRIKGYKILSKLGQGGMGSVYRARQKSLDRPVALKILSPEFAKDKSYVDRFLREARAVASLNHPHIIQGIDVGESGGHYYLAMEFIDGPTLSEVIRSEGPLPEKRALKIADEIAQALSHAHENGMVHRDVKPDNIMIERNGSAKLCDLGLAKSSRGDSSGTSGEGDGLVWGTPHYISPEQAKGESGVDIRSDIYSLGATLFRALTGRTAFSGGSPAIIMAKHVTEPVEDPRNIRPEISEGAAQLVLRMMAKNPADRYATPEDLLKDLRAVVGGKPLKRSARRGGERSSTRAGGERRRPATKRLRGFDLTPYIVVPVLLLFVFGLIMWLLPVGSGEDDSSSPGPEPSAKTGAGTDRPPPPAPPAAPPPAVSPTPPRDPGAGKKPDMDRRRPEAPSRKRLEKTRRESKVLVEAGEFREALDLWNAFPKGLREEVLDAERKEVLAAADRHFRRIVGRARALAEKGALDDAHGILSSAEKIGLDLVTLRLPRERERLDEAALRHKARSEKEIKDRWRARREEILTLARKGEYAAALEKARGARELAPRREEIELLIHDMERMNLRQELAVEGYASRVGRREKVYIHRGARGYRGRVIRVKGGKITVRPEVAGGGDVTIRRRELSVEDIRRYAPISRSDPAGSYDLAVLLIYSGKPRGTRRYLKRSLRDPRFRDNALLHLKSIGR